MHSYNRYKIVHKLRKETHKTAESNRQMPINLLSKVNFKNYKANLYEDVVISKTFTKRRLNKFVV